MNAREARGLMYEMLSRFFGGATVTFSNQSNAVKPQTPLVVLSTVSVNRPINPPASIVDGHPVSYYPTTMALQVDLYTKGAPVSVNPGQNVPMENTALNDMLDFANFIGSEYFINWSHQQDIALAPQGPVRDTTSLITGSGYQFRSTLELLLYFTQKAVGYTGILDPSSIKHSDGGTEDSDPDVYVEPEFTPSASGGGTPDLAEIIVGFFTEAEIKEEKHNEQ